MSRQLVNVEVVITRKPDTRSKEERRRLRTKEEITEGRRIAEQKVFILAWNLCAGLGTQVQGEVAEALANNFLSLVDKKVKENNPL
jgi:hypothetical protein